MNMHGKKHTHKTHDSVNSGPDTSVSPHSRSRPGAAGRSARRPADGDPRHHGCEHRPAEPRPGSAAEWLDGQLDDHELLARLRQPPPLRRPPRRPDRPPAHVPHRSRHLHRLICRLGARRHCGSAVRGTRRPGPRRRAALPGSPLDHHDRLPGPDAGQGARGLGRGRRCRRRDRRPRRRRPHRSRRLAADLLRQHPRRNRTRGRRTQGHPPRRGQAALAWPRRTRRPPRDRQPRHPRLRDHPGRSGRLGLNPDDRAHDTRTGRSRRLRSLGAPDREATAACRADRRPRRRRRPLPDDRRRWLALRPLPPLLPLPPERPRHRARS